MDFELFARFILVFTSLFVIVEPFGVVPTFLGLTKNYSNDEIHKTAFKATLFGAVILIFFSLFGIWIFKFLQIDMNAFRAAGGFLLFLTALNMLQAKDSLCPRCSIEELNSPKEREDISLVPIGIPMLAGPGAITSVMVFSTDHAENHFAHFAIILAAIAGTFVISYAVLRSSVFIKSWLGTSGITVIQRIMGLLLAAPSLQFVVQGVVPLIKTYWI